jgi:hypothetical protein
MLKRVLSRQQCDIILTRIFESKNVKALLLKALLLVKVEQFTDRLISSLKRLPF